MLRGPRPFCEAALTYVALAVILAGSAGAQGTFKVLHNFGGSGDGYHPYSGLTFDSNGNLYGTTTDGPGTGCSGQGCGTVFELKPGGDGSWRENIIHYFNGKDGSYPVAGLVFDRQGNLYGTTACYYGPCDTGDTVFKLMPTSDGNWILSTLYTFTLGKDGAYPIGGVSFDRAGRLWGTTQYGGLYGNGVVYNLAPISAFRWYEIIAHAFAGGTDGAVPYSGLIFDGSGNAYGTTNQGGANGVGTVFKLTPNKTGFGWTETVLYSFKGRICVESPDGAGPVAGLTFDSAGNLYGTTECGGVGGYGTIFTLTHNPDDTWTESVIYAFQGGNDGANPNTPVIFDGSGNLYGTTCCGGQLTDGTIYKLTPLSGSWGEMTLHTFSYSDGAAPGPVILDHAGNLYGTAFSGGPYGSYGGVAYEFIP